MAKRKLQRFEELKGFKNVFEFKAENKGKWGAFFGNDNKIVLELACGKGEYCVGLGRLFPNKNFIGVDIKGNRLWVGAKQALAEGLTNVCFLRAFIDNIDEYFEVGE